MHIPRSPIRLPQGRSGTHSIIHVEHPVGQVLPVITMRTEYNSAQQAVYMKLEEPLRVHELVSDEHGTWMSDGPEEVLQMYEFSKEATGRVLIGGLGLGVVAAFCSHNPNVEAVDVVELSIDVINLVAPHLHGQRGPAPIDVIHADLFGFLEHTELWLWDTAYFDIWQGTGRGTYEQFVRPLRQIVQEKFGNVHLKCWAEEEMLK